MANSKLLAMKGPQILTMSNERMDRLDKISNLVGGYLLRGYKMLADECEKCGTVLLEDRSKKTYCVGCEEVDRATRQCPDNEQPLTAGATVAAAVAPTNREDLYAMAAQQLRRTPSPPPRLMEAATRPLAVRQPVREAADDQPQDCDISIRI
eukprot:sb/3473395/